MNWTLDQDFFIEITIIPHFRQDLSIVLIHSNFDYQPSFQMYFHSVETLWTPKSVPRKVNNCFYRFIQADVFNFDLHVYMETIIIIMKKAKYNIYFLILSQEWSELGICATTLNFHTHFFFKCFMIQRDFSTCCCKVTEGLIDIIILYITMI